MNMDNPPPVLDRRLYEQLTRPHAAARDGEGEGNPAEVPHGARHVAYSSLQF